jgi:homoserine kinase
LLTGDRKRGEAGRGGSPLDNPGDRKRGEAGRGGSPLDNPAGTMETCADDLR